MKLTPSPVEIEEYEGFLPEKDIFQRKNFAEKLSNLIENVSDELVLAIDAKQHNGQKRRTDNTMAKREVQTTQWPTD